MQKTAYEVRISDWSSDVCSSDLAWTASERASSSRPWAIAACASSSARRAWETSSAAYWSASAFPARATACRAVASSAVGGGRLAQAVSASTVANARTCRRSEEHTSELQLLMSISYDGVSLQNKSHRCNYIRTRLTNI